MFMSNVVLYINVVLTLLLISSINCDENENKRDGINKDTKNIHTLNITLDILKYLENKESTGLYDNQTDSQICIGESLFFNKSCYYFSTKNEKHNWINSESICKTIPFSASLLVINTDDELEFIKQAILRIKQKENNEQQLVYHIGFNYTMNNWQWINNISFTSPNNSVNLSNYFNDWNESIEQCGSIVVSEDNNFVLRSTACVRSERFICTYVLNPCYQNDVCGRFGKCINKLNKTSCECTTIFFEGKHCNQLLNFKLITIVAILILLGIMGLFIFIRRALKKTCLAHAFTRTNRRKSNTYVEYKNKDNEENEQLNMIKPTEKDEIRHVD